MKVLLLQTSSKLLFSKSFYLYYKNPWSKVTITEEKVIPEMRLPVGPAEVTITEEKVNLGIIDAQQTWQDF